MTKFPTQLVSLLLAAPALVSAAPAAEAAANNNNGDLLLVSRSGPEDFGAAAAELDFTKRAVEVLFARDGETCNAKWPGNDEKEKQKKYDENKKKMSEATKEAHKGQSACPSTSRTDFDKSKDEKKRKEIKSKCLDAYRKCVEECKNANKACKADAGHQTAVRVCEQQRDYWNAKKP
ncbi:hypothetical protein PG994_008155 [Apiospora phragmitis]|uniref:Uncharacterized protein n=1 Tax=Apiospora phragmitis TaxID=2905665 RepID=A0ABR1UVC2_9PEZI